jgi:kynurenine formamidase
MSFLLFSFLFLSLGCNAMENYTLIDLTHTLHANIPTWDLTCGYEVEILRDYHECEGAVKFRSQSFGIRAAAGTHIDSPAHCIQDAREVRELSLEELIRPCIVIDVSAKADERYVVSLDDIKEFEAQYGSIEPNMFVLFYTGWSKWWTNPEKYHNNYVFPSISREVASYLLEKQICGIGIDTFSPDCPENGYPVHAILLGADKYIVENIAHADKMPINGSFICIMPLKMSGATESPVRLIGLIPNHES